MDKEEQLKKYMKKFDLKNLPEYIEFVLECYDNFLPFCKVVNELERKSDEFKNLSKYHIKALLIDNTYDEYYQKAVKKMEDD